MPVDHPFSRYGPTEQWLGLKAATFDPRIAQNTSALTAGVVSLVELFVPEDFLCSTIHLAMAGTPGATLTNSFAGIYDDQGNLLGRSNDRSSDWNFIGAKEAALINPVRLQGQRRYYIAFLVGSAATAPSIARGGNLACVNSGSVAPFRAGTFGSSLTALPATIALGSVAANLASLWAGLA